MGTVRPESARVGGENRAEEGRVEIWTCPGNYKNLKSAREPTGAVVDEAREGDPTPTLHLQGRKDPS